MDDLTCCLSQIVHLCNETSIFLYQLYKFESQLDKFYSLSRKNFVILERFSLILNDLNLYYKNNFLQFSTNIFNYLSRKYFTVNYSNEIINNFEEDLNCLNQFLKYQKKYYQNIFYYLHKLTVGCLLCMQYRQICTNIQFVKRFVYIRIDLLINLRRLNDEMRILVMKINSNFQRRKYPKEKIDLTNLFRTILLWLILIIIVYYFLWPMVSQTKPKTHWPMWWCVLVMTWQT
jgi:hypothetical protein